MDKNELLKVSDVSFYYGTENILKSINLSVMEGDFIGVIGPNGGGKTTLLKLILGLLKPKDGEVIFDSITSSRTHAANRGLYRVIGVFGFFVGLFGVALWVAGFDLGYLGF